MVSELFKSSEEAIVKCGTSNGPVTLRLYRSWSPNGYSRAVELFERGFYDHSHFFRVIPKFLVQFGISYTEDKELRKFARSTIPDDPKIPELRRFHQGLVSYAGAGPNSRDAQLFISYGSAKSLGSQPWETPIGEVVEGMDNVKNFNSEYRETPKQGKIHQGAKYIEDFFPNLDKFETCSVKRMAPEMFIGNKEALDAQETPQGKPAAVGVATGRIGSNTDAADGELTPIIGGIAVLLLLLFAVARRKVSHRKDI